MNIKQIKKDIEQNCSILESISEPIFVKIPYKDRFISSPKTFKIILWGRETTIYICDALKEGVAFIKGGKRCFVSHETFINSYYKYKS